MTVTHLLTALKALAEECTRDMVLPCRSEKPGGQTSYRAPKVFLMDLPKKTDDTNLIPYIIIQVLTGQDEQKPGDDPNSQAAVRFVAAVFCDDMGDRYDREYYCAFDVTDCLKTGRNVVEIKGERFLPKWEIWYLRE